jgi:hypothetical protein
MTGGEDLFGVGEAPAEVEDPIRRRDADLAATPCGGFRGVENLHGGLLSGGPGWYWPGLVWSGLLGIG